MVNNRSNDVLSVIGDVIVEWENDYKLKKLGGGIGGLGLYKMLQSDTCKFKKLCHMVTVSVYNDPDFPGEYIVIIGAETTDPDIGIESAYIPTRKITLHDDIKKIMGIALSNFVEKIPEEKRTTPPIIGMDFAKDTNSNTVMVVIDPGKNNVVAMLKNPVVESALIDSNITSDDALKILDATKMARGGDVVTVNISGNRVFKATKANNGRESK